MLLVRNVAIFVPVALTWLGIRRATQAFGEYAGAETGAATEQLNFLQFWQAGGPQGGPTYLPAEWRIQNIALMAALLILSIVALTLAGSALQAAARRRQERELGEIERDRVAIAIELVAAMPSARDADPETISEGVAASVDALVAASDSIAESARCLEQTAVGLGSVAPHVDLLNRQLERMNDRLGGDLSQSVDTLGRSVAALGATVDKDMAGALDGAVAGLDEVRAQLARTSASVEFGTKQLRDDLDAIHAGLAMATTGRR
jgi:hypothetical protein